MTSQMPKHETRNIFYCIPWEVNTVSNEIWPAYVILQNTIFYHKNFMKNVA